VKTTVGTGGTEKSIPIQYRRQVQWQLYVTGASRCVFGWVLREEQEDGTFVRGWFELKIVIFERDEKMIEELVEVAERLQQELVFYSQTDKEGI